MMTHHVDFNTIDIFEFEYILGDNPAVSDGAPIALGYHLTGREKWELNSYEQRRGKRKTRKLPVQTRAKILLSKGYSLDAIATATLEANKINQQRISSASSQNWDKINEVSERFSRMFKKSGMGSKQQVVAHSA